MRDIITGGILIALGFVYGGSVFMGDFSPINIFFDGLGTFFIIRGGMAVYREKQGA